MIGGEVKRDPLNLIKVRQQQQQQQQQRAAGKHAELFGSSGCACLASDRQHVLHSIFY
jgi:hypothetical protein